MSEQMLPIDHLAKLARIQLSEGEKSKLKQQLQSIVGYCSKVASVDVSDLEPMVHSFEHDANIWAEDVPAEKVSVDYLSQNAPEMKENQIVVPKVL